MVKGMNLRNLLVERRPKESTVQKKILDYLHSLDECTPVKIIQTQFSRVGVSDILCCYRGVFLAIEVKRDGKEKATPSQLEFGENIIESNGYFIVAYSVSQVKTLINTVDKKLNS